jgi:hypothetical protein
MSQPQAMELIDLTKEDEHDNGYRVAEVVIVDLTDVHENSGELAEPPRRTKRSRRSRIVVEEEEETPIAEEAPPAHTAVESDDIRRLFMERCQRMRATKVDE